MLLALAAAPLALAGTGTIVVGGDADRAAARYFAYVNARGGVNGRKIEYRPADETALVAFEPYRPPPRLEGAVLGRQLARTFPGAKIAVLYPDDESGAALLAGVRRGLGPRVGQIVSAIGYDPSVTDVSVEVAQLRATRAQAFFAFGPAAVEAQAQAARLGWRPRAYLAGGTRALAVGAVSVTAFKDPADPRWRGDPGVALARRLLPGANADDVASMAAAFTLVDVLRHARTARLNEADNPFVIPGINVRAGLINQVALQRWAGTHWSVFTGPLTISP